MTNSSGNEELEFESKPNSRRKTDLGEAKMTRKKSWVEDDSQKWEKNIQEENSSEDSLDLNN